MGMTTRHRALECKPFPACHRVVSLDVGEGEARAGRDGSGHTDLLLLLLLVCIGPGMASAEDNALDGSAGQHRGSSFASPEDPMERVRTQHGGKDNLFDVSALGRFYKGLDSARAGFHESTGFKAGAFHSTVYQYVSDTLPGQDDYGVATISGLYGTWDAIDKSDPTRGQFSCSFPIHFHFFTR